MLQWALKSAIAYPEMASSPDFFYNREIVSINNLKAATFESAVSVTPNVNCPNSETVNF